MKTGTAFDVVRTFEAALCEYTGAPFAVTTNSCTMALLLACEYVIQGHKRLNACPAVDIPKRTYVSVPMAIVQAGGQPAFRDLDWLGFYPLEPFPIWDSARYFTADLYRIVARVQPQQIEPDGFVCVSFHAAKTLGDTQGGAILHNDPAADAWLRRARFDGRTEGVAPAEDKITQIGHHCYLSPDVAARLLWKLSRLPTHIPPLPNDQYPDLSQMEIFR